MVVECTTCRHASLCPEACDRHRRTAIAWAHDRAIEDCRDYSPRLWRGVPGVLDLPAPLSGRRGPKRNDHYPRNRPAATGAAGHRASMPVRPAPLPEGRPE